MTADEQAFHCAAILSAARKLRIRIREDSVEDRFQFFFNDSGIVMAGGIASTRKNALQALCEKLADRWNIPLHDPIQSRYKI